MARKIRVVILDDHQVVLKGYASQLEDAPSIELVGTASFGSDLEPMLANQVVDVVLLDVNVPTDRDNPNPYPILHVIPRLLQIYPELTVLVISMLAERALIQAVMDAGASGYILKDDGASFEQLPAILLSIAGGGIYLSQQAHQLLQRRQKDKELPLTPRQLEAISLCAAHPDWSRSDLAVALGVSHSTARNLLSNAYLRLGVRTLAAAVARARQIGLLAPLTPEFR